nr:MAG TPA: hypothetical protein [Caudoviricetes sp.]
MSKLGKFFIIFAYGYLFICFLRCFFWILNV